ncbi:MAG TPA: hypothetical protein P5186_13655 [Candidatus Paceibacterota bacterium]|nr:hypothetical protein [Candidatus Paceibacterota bacterium]
MSWQIQVKRAKPNPLGKDKSNGYPISTQLLGEWVDIQNIGDTGVSLAAVHLAHSEFHPGCSLKNEASIYWNGTSSPELRPGETVRIHTGRSSDTWQMSPEDRNGVHHHAYAEMGSFVLNNDCGDNVSVWWKDKDGNWHREDRAGYGPRPQEGKILQRMGDRLI